MAGGSDVRTTGSTRSWRWIVAVLAATQAVAPLIAGALAPDFLRGDPASEATISAPVLAAAAVVAGVAVVAVAVAIRRGSRASR